MDCSSVFVFTERLIAGSTHVHVCTIGLSNNVCVSSNCHSGFLVPSLATLALLVLVLSLGPRNHWLCTLQEPLATVHYKVVVMIIDLITAGV